MKKKWMAVILAAFLALPPGAEAKAFDGASILGRILSSGISHSTTVKTKPAVVKRSSGKKNRYKNAMGALENLQCRRGEKLRRQYLFRPGHHEGYHP